MAKVAKHSHDPLEAVGKFRLETSLRDVPSPSSLWSNDFCANGKCPSSLMYVALKPQSHQGLIPHLAIRWHMQYLAFSLLHYLKGNSLKAMETNKTLFLTFLNPNPALSIKPSSFKINI